MTKGTDVLDIRPRACRRDADGSPAAFLKTQDGEAVLVRPDRYVFGTGNPDALLSAFAEKCPQRS